MTGISTSVSRNEPIMYENRAERADIYVISIKRAQAFNAAI